MKKSEALKRISIRSIEETVDAAMATIPANFDIADPQNRARVRTWMIRVCSVVAHNNADDFARAAESAIQEAAALAINPEYYQQRVKTQAKRKATLAMQNRDKPKTRAEMAFDRMRDAPVKM